ncbi:Galactose-specific cell agglutination protein gsf2 [Schizosaccharomyces pombe]
MSVRRFLSTSARALLFTAALLPSLTSGLPSGNVRILQKGMEPEDYLSSVASQNEVPHDISLPKTELADPNFLVDDMPTLLGRDAAVDPSMFTSTFTVKNGNDANYITASPVSNDASMTAISTFTSGKEASYAIQASPSTFLPDSTTTSGSQVSNAVEASSTFVADTTSTSCNPATVLISLPQPQQLLLDTLDPSLLL